MQKISILPGRARLKSHEILHNKPLARYIGAYVDNLYGVVKSSINHVTASVLVVYDIRKTSLDVILDNIQKAISSARDNGTEDIGRYEDYFKTVERREKARRRTILFGFTYLSLKIKHHFFGKFILSASPGVLHVACVATIIAGYPAVKKLYKELTKDRLSDSDALLTVASMSLTILRESSKGVFVLFLKALNDYIKLSADVEGLCLLNRSLGKTAGMAWIRTGEGQETLVPVESLQPGDIISVHQGEVVPAEGEVHEGKAIVNSLYYMGQPIITHIERGNTAYEGLSVLSGDIRVKVAQAPVSVKKAGIARTGLDMQKRVSKYQEMVAPVAMIVSGASRIAGQSMLNSLSVILSFTPSATGVALSTGLKSYFTLLNRHKIYLRNPNTIEKLTTVNHVVFDKTGTLTYGKMEINKIELFDDEYSERELMRICAACEVDNYHPISITIQEEVVDDYDVGKVQSSVLLPQKGISALYDGHKVTIGNRELMEENGVDIRRGLESFGRYEKELYTPVLVGIDGMLRGMIVMKDIIREECFALMERLRKRREVKISLVSGDSIEKARDLADRLGIDNVYGNCSHEDKQRIVQELKKDYTVMMVGDGINDVLAMREADISVSLADSSCDRVKLQSDCIIFEDSMIRLGDLICLSQKSYNTINRNINLSIGYNFVSGIMAFTGRFDTFAAKSINTVNSLMVLMLNMTVEHMSRERVCKKEAGEYTTI